MSLMWRNLSFSHMRKFSHQLTDFLILILWGMEHMVQCIMAFFGIRSITIEFAAACYIVLSSFPKHNMFCMKLQEVAIKKMTATKTKEFMAEMKVLCKVHHTNLVNSYV